MTTGVVILVVDDEPMIADTMSLILRRSGYEAVSVYDAEAALDFVLSKPPQMVISDVSLPGMNGIELGLAIRRIYPECKVVLSSGHSRSGELLANALSSGDDFTFLQKPVQPKDLLAFVAECLKPDLHAAPRR
jgi:DNA-binding NtrC family response regulator